MGTGLSVNVNKVALLRNSRAGNTPDLLVAVRACLEAGAFGITVHPRPDERHIRFVDVLAIRDLIRKEYPEAELNVEGNPLVDRRYLSLIEEARPNQCTLVPDGPEQLTSDRGWDLKQDWENLRPVIVDLRRNCGRVSLFMDAENGNLENIERLEVDRIELYTGPYALAHAQGGERQVIGNFTKLAGVAESLGLGVNAGHDLSTENLACFLSWVPGVLEVSIGQALVAESLFVGLKTAVGRYLDILSKFPSDDEGVRGNR